MNDLLYTLGLIRRNPGFVLLCIAVISLGIMMSTALFSLPWNFRLKSPDLLAAERWVTLTLSSPELADDRVDGFDTTRYLHLRDNARSFSTLGAARTRIHFNVSDGEVNQVFAGSSLDANLMLATGVQALLGRNLQAEDNQSGMPPVVVLGYQLWQDHFSGDASLVGRTIRVEGLDRTVVGVMPEGFGFPFNASMWTPLQLDHSVEPARSAANLAILGVLAPGIGMAQAGNETRILSARFNEQMQEFYPREFTTDVAPFVHLQPFPWTATLVMLVLTLAVPTLVVFNIGNLLLFRISERSHEIAVRNAVGATQLSLIRTVLLESLLICIAGALLGTWLTSIALAGINKGIVEAFAGDNLPFWFDFSMNGTFVGTTILCTLLVWLLGGGVPAWSISRQNIASVLAAGSAGLGHRNKLKWTRTVLYFEIIISCFLLIVAMAMIVGASLDIREDFGFDTQDLFAGEVRIGNSAADGNTLHQLASNLRLEQQLTAGIVDATYTSATPGNQSLLLPYTLEDRDTRIRDFYPSLQIVSVADNYFDVLAVRLVDGRLFNAADTTDSAAVGIIDRRLAAQLWPDGSALGKRIQVDPDQAGMWITIVGVVDTLYHEAQATAGAPRRLTLFRPFAQSSPPLFVSIIRTQAQAVPARLMQESVAATDRDMAIYRVKPLLDHMLTTARPYLLLRNIFVTVFVLVCVLVASVVYGVMSRMVINRQGEIGLRRALGASNRQAVMVFIREALRILAIGLGVGGTGGLLVGSSIALFLPGVLPFLPAIGLGMVLFIAVLVMVSAWIPALRCVQHEVGDVLRCE